jgi:hypothetical protein
MGGQGVGLRFNPNTPTSQLLVTWASLRTTGFEIEGAQRVVCRMSGAGYLDDTLLCPRGRVREVPVYEGGVHEVIDVAEVLAEVDSGIPTYNIVSHGVASQGRYRVAGVALTNSDSAVSSGYIVVGVDQQLMMVKKLASTATPEAGLELYLSIFSGYAAFSNDEAFPVFLGTVASVGARTNLAEPCAIKWQAGVPCATQLARLASPVSKTTSTPETTLFSLPVIGDVLYRMSVYIPYTASAGGIRVRLTFAGTALTYSNSVAGEIIETSPLKTIVAAAKAMDFGSGNLIYATGARLGFVRLDGSLLFSGVTSPITIAIDFAQSVTNPTPSVAEVGAYLMLTRAH